MIVLCVLYHLFSDVTLSPLIINHIESSLHLTLHTPPSYWPGWSAHGYWASPWRCPQISLSPPALGADDIAPSSSPNVFLWSSCHHLKFVRSPLSIPWGLSGTVSLLIHPLWRLRQGWVVGSGMGGLCQPRDVGTQWAVSRGQCHEITGILRLLPAMVTILCHSQNLWAVTD